MSATVNGIAGHYDWTAGVMASAILFNAEQELDKQFRRGLAPGVGHKSVNPVV